MTRRRFYTITFFRFINVLLLIALVIQPIAFAQKGTLEWGRITSPALEGNLIGDPATRSFAVYLPPSYENSDKRYPVIYVLHGYGGGTGSHTNMKSTLDFMIRERDIGEMIAVFVDGSNRFGGSFYLSSETIGDYGLYITRDIVNHIDANYRTLVERENRGITGFSMGGFGAMHLALTFPDVFNAVVAHGGPYDAASNWTENLAKGMARIENDWNAFSRAFWMTQAISGIYAGVSPNPDNPPFFLNRPYTVIDGKVTVVPEVRQQHIDADIVHGDLPRYLNQPVRLRGIMIVHGSSDGVVPVSEARTLDEAMTDLGVDHVYDEHGGGHTFSEHKSLQFLSDHLQGVELLDEGFSVHPISKLAITWGMMKTHHR